MSKKKPAQKGLKLQIDNEVTRCIRQHARAHMKTEVCGVLIGEAQGETINVQASIEASSAAQAGTHVTFTQDAWEEIYRVKDEQYPDHRIVGWYHSHPGFGVFLSEHDTFIHRNFFSSPNQVAWVYDPHTDEEGCFGWFGDEIQRIAALSVVDLNGDGEERTPKERTHPDYSDEDSHGPNPDTRTKNGTHTAPPRWLNIVVKVTAYLSVAILGFFIAFFFFPTIVGIAIDPRTGEPLIIDGRPVIVGRTPLDRLLHPQSEQPSSVLQPSTTPQSNPHPGDPK